MPIVRTPRCWPLALLPAADCRLPPQPLCVPDTLPPHASNPSAVLGRFLHSLNAYCAEAHGMAYQESDYHVYDFAKASVIKTDG